jgi:hypothetical protein
VYWIVFALFNVCEYWLDTFLFFVPMYTEVKLCFFLFLQYNQGALYLYDNHIEPFVAKHEDNIDKLPNEAIKLAKRLSQQGFEKAKESAGPAFEQAKAKAGALAKQGSEMAAAKAKEMAAGNKAASTTDNAEVVD